MKPTLITLESVSAEDAKTHLPKLLERTERGERFVITRHGKPVAKLVPFEPYEREPLAETLATVAAIRRRLAQDGVSLASILADNERASGLKHAGHRY